MCVCVCSGVGRFKKFSVNQVTFSTFWKPSPIICWRCTHTRGRALPGAHPRSPARRRHGTARHGTAGLCSRSALLCFAVSRRELLAPPAPCPSSGCSRRAGGGGCCVELIRTKLEQKVVFCSRETGRSWLLTVSAAPVLPAPGLK